jgi:transcriptional regulator with XRE-family HTH domain
LDVNLKHFRKSAGLTQGSLAKALKISRSTVAMWESGVSKPRADKLVALAKLLDCTVDDLLKDTA